MALLDWVVITLFALALIGIIVWVMRQKQNNAADYFLGGKDATWIAIEPLSLHRISAPNISSVLQVPELLPEWQWLIGRFRDG